MAEVVDSYDDVVTNVQVFNQGLDEGEGLEQQLSYFRAFYYIPEKNAVGPSKFVGYKGMNATEYLRKNAELDGRVTEPVLAKWFEPVEEASNEGQLVRRLTRMLLHEYGKVLNARARFNVPIGWRLGDGAAVHSSQGTDATANVTQARPIVEVFWRAYLGLYPEDQRALAEKIIRHTGAQAKE
ncbi:MAG: hypothetical protein HY681_07270 [Chloroflexi bacterium]|nr:hypothetical protein [Chloroflexota bacterium]